MLLAISDSQLADAVQVVALGQTMGLSLRNLMLIGHRAHILALLLLLTASARHLSLGGLTEVLVIILMLDILLLQLRGSRSR